MYENCWKKVLYSLYEFPWDIIHFFKNKLISDKNLVIVPFSERPIQKQLYSYNETLRLFLNYLEP